MKSKILILFITLINHMNALALDKAYQKYYAEQEYYAQQALKKAKKAVSFYEPHPKCLICNKKIEYEYLGHTLNEHINFYNKSLKKHEYRQALEESYNIERYISFIIIDSYLQSSALEMSYMLKIKDILLSTRAILKRVLS